MPIYEGSEWREEQENWLKNNGKEGTTNLTHDDKQHQWNNGECQEAIPAQVRHDPQCQNHLGTGTHGPETLK